MTLEVNSRPFYIELLKLCHFVAFLWFIRCRYYSELILAYLDFKKKFDDFSLSP